MWCISLRNLKEIYSRVIEKTSLTFDDKSCRHVEVKPLITASLLLSRSDLFTCFLQLCNYLLPRDLNDHCI